MSFRRIQSQTNNRNVYLENRLNNFTKPPMHEGDLYVEKNVYASGNYYLDRFVLIPAGTIIMSAAVTEPGGWLDCNGQTLVKGTIGYVHYDLFLAIGYTYGGSGANFNVPDMRGRVGVGLGQGAGLSNRPLADISGSETHTLTEAQIPAHRHELTRRINPDSGAFDTDSAHSNESSAATTDRDVDGSFTTTNTGGGLPHNNMQPYVVLRYLIKY